MRVCVARSDFSDLKELARGPPSFETRGTRDYIICIILYYTIIYIIRSRAKGFGQSFLVQLGRVFARQSRVVLNGSKYLCRESIV